MSSHRGKRLLAGAAALLAAASPARAHDFWVQPSHFTPQVGELVHVRLFVGHHDELEELPRLPDHIRRFEVLGAGENARSLRGIDGRKPAAFWRPQEKGVLTLVYQSDPSHLELPAAKFEAYLREEGMERARAERTRCGESESVGRERYSRCCKALIRVGEGTSGFDRTVGLPYEIIALSNPYDREAGDALVFELRFEGEPAADRQVELHHLEDPEASLVLRTDAAGRVRLVAPKAGTWMVGSVYMRRTKGVDPAEAERADWESFWATLTFELAG